MTWFRRREQLEVDVDVIEEERVEHLAEQERRAGRARDVAERPSLRHDALHLARAADREDVRRAEAERRRDRRVLAKPAVEIELVVDPHGREEHRDRRARERVVRADVIGAEERARRRRLRDVDVGRRLHEDDRAARSRPRSSRR